MVGEDVPDMTIRDIPVRHYLIGDSAFTLNKNMLKSSTQSEMRSNPLLRT